MSDGMGREPAYLSSHATNRYFIPNWGINCTWLNGVSGMGMKHKTQMTISRTVVNL